MKVFKYWAKLSETISVEGSPKVVTLYGGSNVSHDDAVLQARRQIPSIESRICGESRDEDYERPIREQVIKTIDQSAVITRNYYGVLVLNVLEMAIIDIDQYYPSFLRRLFGPKPKSKFEGILDQVRRVIRERYKDRSFRVYQTPNGARVILTDSPVTAKSALAKKLLRDFRSDVLYSSFCVRQNCFRARLTPKPSRCGQPRLTVKFPFENEAEEQAHERWTAEYNGRASRFAACKFIETIGSHNRFSRLIDEHDGITQAHGSLPLA